MRVANLLLSTAKSREEADEPLRVETIYNEERARLKIILVGSLETSASLLKLIKAILETQ